MPTRKTVLLVLSIMAILFAGASIDYYFGGVNQSHIGQAMGQILHGQWQVIWDMIVRKLLMNWKLIQYSIWGKVLLAVFAGIAFFTYYSKGIIKTIETKYSYYIIFPLIYLVLQEKLRSE